SQRGRTLPATSPGGRTAEQSGFGDSSGQGVGTKQLLDLVTEIGRLLDLVLRAEAELRRAARGLDDEGDVGLPFVVLEERLQLVQDGRIGRLGGRNRELERASGQRPGGGARGTAPRAGRRGVLGRPLHL